MKRLLRQWILRRIWSAVQVRQKKEQPIVIALTGTVGKTSTKEAIALVLEQSGKKVVKTIDNLNTEMGVALSLLGFDATPDGWLEWFSVLLASWFPPTLVKNSQPYYVLEFSADKPGDIAFLTKQFSLQAAVLTAITPAHMQSYPDLTALIQEKTSIFRGLQKGGYAVLNADDQNQKVVANQLEKTVLYGIRDKKSAVVGVWAHDLQLKDSGLCFQLDFSAAQKIDSIGKSTFHSLSIQSKVIGRHQLYPLLAAAAVGYQEKVPFEKIKKALECYSLLPGRGRILAGQKETTIIDDSYNASPDSVKAGLIMLRPFAQKRRVVAVLGRMNELGDGTEAAQKEIAKFAADKVDYLLVVGQYEKEMVQSALAAGLSQTQVIGFATTDQLADKLEQLIQREDVIYFKGSQNGVFLERAVKKIMAHPEEASQQLVRQSNWWKNHS